jgi:hypothetical protein
VHPAVLETYLNKTAINGLKEVADEILDNHAVDLRANEKAVLRFLESQVVKKAA